MISIRVLTFWHKCAKLKLSHLQMVLSVVVLGGGAINYSAPQVSRMGSLTGAHSDFDLVDAVFFGVIGIIGDDLLVFGN